MFSSTQIPFLRRSPNSSGSGIPFDPKIAHGALDLNVRPGCVRGTVVLDQNASVVAYHPDALTVRPVYGILQDPYIFASRYLKPVHTDFPCVAPGSYVVVDVILAHLYIDARSDFNIIRAAVINLVSEILQASEPMQDIPPRKNKPRYSAQ